MWWWSKKRKTCDDSKTILRTRIAFYSSGEKFNGHIKTHRNLLMLGRRVTKPVWGTRRQAHASCLMHFTIHNLYYCITDVLRKLYTGGVKSEWGRSNESKKNAYPFI